MIYRSLLIFGLAVSVFSGASAQKAQQTQSSSAASAETKQAQLSFRKIFKSSYPEYVEIKVNEDGSGTWDIRQLDDQPDPQPLQLTEALTRKMFSLAQELHDFDGVNLEVPRRIADLGQKTFHWQKGAESHEVTFNYTLNNSAEQLLAIFDGLQRQELDLSDMQRTMRYDQLGINDVVLRVQKDVNEKLLPDPQRLLPVLDKIAADSDLIDIARQRARAIAERIRTGRS